MPIQGTTTLKGAIWAINRGGKSSYFSEKNQRVWNYEKRGKGTSIDFIQKRGGYPRR